MSRGFDSAFALAPETLMAISKWGFRSIAYTFCGVANPLQAPRYSWARHFAPAFDYLHLDAARRADLLLAAANNTAIEELVSRSKGLLSGRGIISLPTAFDSQEFRPMPKPASRTQLGLNVEGTILVACGRISQAKGWKFLLDSFRHFHSLCPNSLLIFVGDGEDRSILERNIAAHGMASSVRVTGFVDPSTVALYLNASDAVLCGSHSEGWPTAIVEALACSRPVVTTNVSGVTELIADGVTGTIVTRREALAFSDAIITTLALPDATCDMAAIARNYSLDAMASRLQVAWPPLRAGA